MSGFYLKGGLIEFVDTFLIPVPNTIIFQYNPETMTHGWTPATTGSSKHGHPSNPLAVSGLPQETFSFTLAMDANDTIADGNAAVAKIAQFTGVYSRLAALEMLLFPVAPAGGGLVGTVTASLSLGGTSKPKATVPIGQLPVVLFVWGPGRIVPVRVMALSITEKLYDADFLNPTHVEAQITLRVLTTDELKYINGALGAVARTAYNYTQVLRVALAAANVANATTSLIDML
jgi:hypothetical protein